MVNTGRKFELTHYAEDKTVKVGREVADKLLHKDEIDGCSILVSAVGEKDGKLAYIGGTNSCNGPFFLKALEVSPDDDYTELSDVLKARQQVDVA